MDIKMSAHPSVCKICKEIAKAIPQIEHRITTMWEQHDRPTSKTPSRIKMFQDSMKSQIEEHEHYVQALRKSYMEILGVEYSSEQTYDIPKDQMDDIVRATLYRRGITNVTCENIEPHNGEEYVRLHWVEKIE